MLGGLVSINHEMATVCMGDVECWFVVVWMPRGFADGEEFLGVEICSR